MQALTAGLTTSLLALLLLGLHSPQAQEQVSLALRYAPVYNAASDRAVMCLCGISSFSSLCSNMVGIAAVQAVRCW